MGFSDEGVLLLTKLDQARLDAGEIVDGAEGWITLESYDARLIGAMKRNKHIAEKPGSRPAMYRITVKGHDALMEALAAPEDKPKKRAKVSPLHENGNGTGLKPVVPAAEPAALAADGCDGCDGQCVYRQAVEILAARVPGMNELVDALKLLNKAR